MTNSFRQAVFNFDVRTLTGRTDFFTAPCNAEAVALIDSALTGGFHGGLIYGEKGCGKTHLAHLFAEVIASKTGREPAFLQKPDLIDATYAVIEFDEKPDEEALFHLINDYKNKNGYLLITSNVSPVVWDVKLNDLRTRLKALPTVAIGSPDERLMNAVLLKQFADRQISVAPEVISYLLKNMERSFSAVSFVVKRADELSLQKKSAITVPLIKQVLTELS